MAMVLVASVSRTKTRITMNDLQYKDLAKKLDDITLSLQKIVILLSRQQNATFIEDPNRKLTEEEARKQYWPLLEPIEHGGANNISDINICNCGDSKSGELTGGWICPVHGQQY